MKKEFSTKPECVTELWPGMFDLFSWKDIVMAIPSPVFLVTGWKSNGKENCCLQSWASFASDSGELICILGWVSRSGHMYQSLKETGCCVLNFPTGDIYDRCAKTIENNQFEIDEITASGLVAEKAILVNAPRIAECFLNIECEFLWEKQNFEDSNNMVVALKAVHFCMDDKKYNQEATGRYGKSGYLLNLISPVNPETGEAESDTLGIVELYK